MTEFFNYVLNNPAFQAVFFLMIPVIGIVLYAFPRLSKK